MVTADCHALPLEWGKPGKSTFTVFPCSCGWESTPRRPEEKGSLEAHFEEMRSHLGITGRIPVILRT